MYIWNSSPWHDKEPLPLDELPDFIFFVVHSTLFISGIAHSKIKHKKNNKISLKVIKRKLTTLCVGEVTDGVRLGFHRGPEWASSFLQAAERVVLATGRVGCCPPTSPSSSTHLPPTRSSLEYSLPISLLRFEAFAKKFFILNFYSLSKLLDQATLLKSAQ